MYAPAEAVVAPTTAMAPPVARRCNGVQLNVSMPTSAIPTTLCVIMGKQFSNMRAHVGNGGRRF
jgi:hypothetical protein